MGRDTRPRKSLGASLHNQIKESRVLMVGAGGIGCELLKNLVLTGFGEIHIVDLDTIDLSNLNRQFLFGMQHIKKSKAIVAKEIAGKFNPNVKLEAHHANIKDPNFNVKWFKGFNIVFNALDNLDARKHVNRMCLAADVPLIESGTTGYNGQVQIIKRGETECYDCNPKPVPKSFPVCTIRSTPSQPIHCIVWAKSYLFAEVFGTSEESTPELDPTEDSENAQEIANLKREAEELKNIREKMDSPDFAEAVFSKVFTRDINRLRSMEDMWKSRKKPEPLDYGKVLEESKSIDASISRNDQSKWSLAENFTVFADSLKRLATRMLELKATMKEGDTPPILSFDKDNEDTLDFVAASANLRSSIFDIEIKSKFDIKQMAGNIIPAIATTNAITAGLCVLQAFKVLQNKLSEGRMIFLAKSADRACSSETLAPPNPSCETCCVARLTLSADITRATLNDLIKILRSQLNYNEEISVLTGNQLIYDIDYDDNVNTPLKDLGFQDETFVTIVDDSDSDDDEPPRVNLVIAITHDPEMASDQYPISEPEKIEIQRKPRPKPEPSQDQDDNLEMHDVTESRKRKLEDGLTVLEDASARMRQIVPEDAGPVQKKVKVAETIVIEDDEAIMID
ncbi:putative ubiquitin-like activating enzyme [Ascodesmis nigricans]|uniref:Ubiquitin-activating enzyme E1-like n=1 Tax=Ascodesmis nigricans TaxID=341454 RepID=A0A4S2N0I5_9PEZI|nr:putative ubiquitin-like activating enzyme [Ascodesmis nigricans]